MEGPRAARWCGEPGALASRARESRQPGFPDTIKSADFHVFSTERQKTMCAHASRREQEHRRPAYGE